MLKDPSLQLVQLRPGLKPELVNQAPARCLEDVERVRLAPGAIEGEHQAREQSLTQRVLVNEPLELGRELGAVTERELRLEPRLERAQPELLESLRVRLERFAVEQVAPGRPAPQRERDRQLAQCCVIVIVLSRRAGVRDESLEFVDVELAGLDAQQIAARLASQTVLAEELPQPVEVCVERLSGAPRWPLPPERINEVIARDDLVAVQQQHRQQRPLLSPPERDRLPVLRYRERSKRLKPHAGGMKPPIRRVCEFLARWCVHHLARSTPIRRGL